MTSLFPNNTEEAFVLSSLKEFVKMWGSGCQAKLQLECKDRKVFMHMSSQLGAPDDVHYVPHFLPPHVQQHYHHHGHDGYHQQSPRSPPRPRKKSPSQIERDKARAAHHRAQQLETRNETAASADSNPTSSPPSQVFQASAQNTSVPTAAVSVAVVSEPVNISPTLSTVPVDTTSPLTPTFTSLQVQASNEEGGGHGQDVHLDLPHDLGIVRATAVFETSPNPQLKQEDFESLQKFILSEEHLKKNIVNMNFERVSSRSFRNSQFTHTVSVELHVSLSHLWESPVNYIGKHLGKNEWKRSNGTVITLAKIYAS